MRRGLLKITSVEYYEINILYINFNSYNEASTFVLAHLWLLSWTLPTIAQHCATIFINIINDLLFTSIILTNVQLVTYICSDFKKVL